jgi:hypothetical protein
MWAMERWMASRGWVSGEVIWRRSAAVAVTMADLAASRSSSWGGSSRRRAVHAGAFAVSGSRAPLPPGGYRRAEPGTLADFDAEVSEEPVEDEHR